LTSISIGKASPLIVFVQPKNTPKRLFGFLFPPSPPEGEGWDEGELLWQSTPHPALSLKGRGSFCKLHQVHNPFIVLLRVFAVKA
jgi:hypothetical protein